MTYEQETLWLAGWLEGEGCFMCRPNCNEIRITVASTDEDIVRRAAIICGNRRVHLDTSPTRIKKTYKPIWMFEVLGDDAVNVGKRILPFMGQRRKAKIEMLLAKAANRMSRKDSGRLGAQRRWGKKEKSASLPFAVNE